MLGILIVALIIGVVVAAPAVDMGLALGSATAERARAIDNNRQRKHDRRMAWGDFFRDALRDRRQRRHERAGGEGPYRPGATSYWKELYGAFWWRRIAAVRARQGIQPPVYVPPGGEPAGQQPERPPRPASEGQEQPPNGQPDGGGIADTGPVISVVHDDDTYMPRRDLIATPADDVDSDCPRGTQCRICGQHVDAGDVCEDCATASQRPHPHPNGRCPYRPLRCCMDDTARTCDTCTDPTTCRTPDGTYRHPWCKPTPPDPTSQGDTVTAPTTDDAQEVNTNADLRRVFTGNQTDGRRLLELMTLSAAENATILREAQELEAYVASLNVDAGVAAAAADVKSHLIPQEQIDTWSERADQVVNTSADGLAALDKYHDTETKLANSHVDGATLSSAAA